MARYLKETNTKRMPLVLGYVRINGQTEQMLRTRGKPSMEDLTLPFSQRVYFYAFDADADVAPCHFVNPIHSHKRRQVPFWQPYMRLR
jgi:hypothetical protein